MTSISEEILNELPDSAEILNDIAASCEEYRWLSMIFYLAFINYYKKERRITCLTSH